MAKSDIKNTQDTNAIGVVCSAIVRPSLERAIHAKRRGLYPLEIFEGITSFDSATADYYIAFELLDMTALEQMLEAWDAYEARANSLLSSTSEE